MSAQNDASSTWRWVRRSSIPGEDTGVGGESGGGEGGKGGGEGGGEGSTGGEAGSSGKGGTDEEEARPV